MAFKLLIVGLFLSVCQVNGFEGGFSSPNPEKILLRDVQVLTLKEGQMTTGRQLNPIPQLKCVGGSAQGKFNPKIVQCYNRGWDGQEIQWECKTELDNKYRFEPLEIICEVYHDSEDSEDPYILKGSCGLEYTLELTKEGQQKAENNKSVKSTQSSNSDDTTFVNAVLWVLSSINFVAIVLFFRFV